LVERNAKKGNPGVGRDKGTCMRTPEETRSCDDFVKGWKPVWLGVSTSGKSMSVKEYSRTDGAKGVGKGWEPGSIGGRGASGVWGKGVKQRKTKE